MATPIMKWSVVKDFALFIVIPSVVSECVKSLFDLWHIKPTSWEKPSHRLDAIIDPHAWGNPNV
jgi:hypothetical protein